MGAKHKEDRADVDCEKDGSLVYSKELKKKKEVYCMTIISFISMFTS